MPSDLTLKEPILPAPQISKEDKLAMLAGKNPLQDEIDLMKGAAIGTLTLGPDAVHYGTELINWATSVASHQLYGDDRGALDLPVWTGGDNLRESVGLDPTSTWGMVGEMVGGWENAIAKGGAAAVKGFRVAMEVAPEAAIAYLSAKLMKQKAVPGEMYTFVGPKGTTQLSPQTLFDLKIGNMDAAARRLDAGENDATVLAETGWFRGNDGKMKVYIPDDAVRINTAKFRQRALRRNLDVGETRHLNFYARDVIQADYILEAYPQLKDLPISVAVTRLDDAADGTPRFTVRDPSVDMLGGAEEANPWRPHGRIHLLNLREDLPNKESLRRTFIHEINHVIQDIEGFHSGADGLSMMRVSDGYSQARLDYRLAKEVIDANLDPIQEGSNGIANLIEAFLRRQGSIDDSLPQETIDRVVGNFMPKVENLLTESPEVQQAILGGLKHLHEQWLMEAGRHLHLGNQTPTEFMAVLESMNDIEAYHSGMVRYLAQGGEVDSRIQEMLSTRTLEEARRLMVAAGHPENLVGLEEMGRGAGLTREKIVSSQIGTGQRPQVVDFPTATPRKAHGPLDSIYQLNNLSLPKWQRMLNDPEVQANPELLRMTTRSIERAAESLRNLSKQALEAGATQKQVDDAMKGIEPPRPEVDIAETIMQIGRENPNAFDNVDWINYTNDGKVERLEAGGRIVEREIGEVVPIGSRSSRESIQDRPASDPMANWEKGQDSGRGGQEWGPALDVPNEGSFVGAQKLPEGTDFAEEPGKLFTPLEEVPSSGLRTQVVDSPTKKAPISSKNFNENKYYTDRMRYWRETGEDLETAGRMASDDVDRIKANMKATEKFSNGVNTVTLKTTLHGTAGELDLEFLMNPTEASLRRWAAKNLSDEDGYKAVRVATDVQNNLYIWDANKALHDDFIKSTDIKLNIEDDWTDVDGVEPADFAQIFGDNSAFKPDVGIDVANLPHPRKMQPEAKRLWELQEELSDIEFSGGSTADQLKTEDEIWDIIDKTGLLEEEGWQQSGWWLEKKDGWETLTLPDGTEIAREAP